MSRCIAPEEFQGLFAERLSAQERQALEAHVDACTQCQQTLARLLDDSDEIAIGVNLQLLRLVRPSTTSDVAEEFLRCLQKNPPQPAPVPPGPRRQGETAQIHFPKPPTERGPLGQLESYHIVAELGRGAFGFVFQAYDEHLDRLVAIKVLKPELAASASDRARFEREARAAAAVRHDHIITIHRVGGTPGFALPYFVMEYLDGETLSDRLERKGPLPPRMAVELVRQVAQGLAAAHGRGLVHRDIKPSNILLEKNSGRAKITDFGLARPVDVPTDKLTGSGNILGTLPYMSPEQIVSADRIDPRSDVYSLGVVLYELLTGEVPFRGQKHLVLQQVVHEEPRPPRKSNDDIPRDLETITLKCLAKEPSRRYQSAAEFEEDLRRWWNGEPIRARPVGATGKLWRWCRRKPAIASLITLLLIVAVGGFVSVTWQWRLTEEARQHEAEQRQQALANFEQACQAVDAMLTEVGEKHLADLPWMDGVRQKLLQKSLDFYEAFLKERSADPTLRFETGRAHLRVASIYEMLGRDKDADKAYLAALELLEELRAAAPNRPDYRRTLAKGYSSRGSLLWSSGHVPEAKKALQQAIAIQRWLAADFPGPPEYQYDLAFSLNNLGVWHYKTGQIPGAKESYHHALGILQTLVVDFPTRPDFQRALAKCHNDLGALLQDINQRSEAKDEFEQALSLYQQLVADFPTRPNYRSELAHSHNNLGVLLDVTGKRAEGEEAYRRALKIQQQLTADFPTRPDFQRDLAGSYQNVGVVLRSVGKLAEAEQAQRRSLEIRKGLVSQFPTRPEYRQGLAFSHYSLGLLLKNAGKLAEGNEAYRQALGLVQQLVADFPTVPDYQSFLGTILNSLAILLLEQGETTEAQRLVEKALSHQQMALRANPKHPNYRKGLRDSYGVLAETLVRLGKHVEAAQAATELTRVFPDSGEECYLAAGFVARCVPLAERDAGLPGAKCQELAQAHGDQAMVLLREAIQKGFGNTNQAKEDTDLNPLRARTDFQRLLKEMEAEAKNKREVTRE